MHLRRPACHSEKRLLLHLTMLCVLAMAACTPSPEPPAVDDPHAIEADIDAFLAGTSAAQQVRAILVSHQGKPSLLHPTAVQSPQSASTVARAATWGAGRCPEVHGS
jgi:hypothetical protein